MQTFARTNFKWNAQCQVINVKLRHMSTRGSNSYHCYPHESFFLLCWYSTQSWQTIQLWCDHSLGARSVIVPTQNCEDSVFTDKKSSRTVSRNTLHHIVFVHEVWSPMMYVVCIYIKMYISIKIFDICTPILAFSSTRSPSRRRRRKSVHRKSIVIYLASAVRRRNLKES